MMVQRLNKQLNGEGDVDNIDILGNTTESAIQATKQAPVSYTHLDVYKRQIQSHFPRYGFIIL